MDDEKFNIMMRTKSMRKIKYSRLKWLAGLNLHLLAEVLPENKFREFIVKFSREKRIDRRIVLPSHSCIKKIFFHYLWSQVENGEATWEEIKRDFYSEFKTLKSAGISKKLVKKLYVKGGFHLPIYYSPFT